MRKPDVTFQVTVSPTFHVYGCDEKRAQESRGLFGFHQYTSCPNCRVVSSGFEVWGENGHRQATLATRDNMRYWVHLKAREQWRMKDGRIMGYRFRMGSPLYYVGA